MYPAIAREWSSRITVNHGRAGATRLPEHHHVQLGVVGLPQCSDGPILAAEPVRAAFLGRVAPRGVGALGGRRFDGVSCEEKPPPEQLDGNS